MAISQYSVHYTAQPLDITLTALAGLEGAADSAPYFTAIDKAALMTVTPFMRTLLDDPDQASAQATLGIGQAGSSTFLGLSDTPDSYTGQVGNTLVVNPAGTGLEFGTPSAAESRFLLMGV